MTDYSKEVIRERAQARNSGPNRKQSGLEKGSRCRRQRAIEKREREKS